MTTTHEETIIDIPLVEVLPYDGDAPAETRTHIVKPGREDMTAQDVVDLARLTGETITALCGYVWIPKFNPEKFPICKKCLDIWNASQ